METEPDRPHLDDPEHWLHTQIEWIDGQLSSQVEARHRHRADVAVYERRGVTMPKRYHERQVDHCTTRIGELLDLRLRVVQKAQAQGVDSALHPM